MQRIYLFFLSQIFGQYDQLFVGSRPLSMGGAFTAVADDANAITWNPAGLPGLRRTEFTSTYADLYAMGITQSYLGFVRPFSDRIAIGLDWSSVGFDDKELAYSENKLNFAMGFQPHKIFSLGFTLKYLMRDMLLDDASYGKGTGVGYDAGLLIQPRKNLKLGLGLYDLNGTSISYKDKTSETVLGQAFKLGISYMPINELTVAADFGDRIQVGAEYVLGSRISFRGGIQKGIKSNKEKEILVPSAGISLKFKSLVIEYGFESHPYLNPTHRFSIALQLSPASLII